MKKYSNLFLPLLFLFDEYAISLSELSEENKFQNPLKYCYGSLRCKWANNYDSYYKFNTDNGLLERIELFNSKGLTPVLNFSKVNIEKEDLEDKECNEMLNVCNEHDCELIVASEKLFDYIKNKYPNIKITASANQAIYKFQGEISSFEEETEFYNSLASKYDRIVLRSEYTKQMLKTNVFKLDNPEKFINIINNACEPDCEYYKECHCMKTTDFSYCKNKEIRNEDTSLMLSTKQIEDLNTMNYENFIVMDNKQPLLFLITLFNTLLFDTQGDFKKLDKKINDEIKKNLIARKFLYDRQYWFFTKYINQKLSIVDL